MQAVIDQAAAWPSQDAAEKRLGYAWWAFEMAVALVMIVFFAPLMICVASLIYLEDGGPIFFGHERIGQNGRRFKVLKFRTMVVDADVRLDHLLAADPGARFDWENYHKLRDDPRITTLGKFLRKSSIDELPQLINVLRQEMSFVGPRPIVDAEIRRYGRFYREYCSVRPGITGLWQVSGRNDTSYRRRVAMDVLYSRRASPSFNLRLVALTVPAVLRWRGSY